GRGLVFEKNSREEEREWRDLPRLKGTGYLDGEVFSVFAPDRSAERVQSDSHEFDVDPESDGLAFDQVQAYYNLERGLHWLEENLGFSMRDETITVRLNTLVGGRPDNAEYVPGTPESGPEILVARGSLLKNLGRDSD